MNKNIAIQEGGISKQLSVDKLKTNLVSGGSCLWVPEDDVQLGTKYITENGTYKAQSDGLYGYSEVSVTGIGSVTGRDPDTGEEVEVHRDPDTGEIVKTIIATEIRVITLPTKTVYTHGESINYSGIVVHAYSAEGTDLGAIPFNQLIFPETKADIQKTDGMTDGQGLNAIMLSYTPHYYVDENGDDQTSYCSQVVGAYNGNPAAYGYRDEPGVALFTRYDGDNYGKSISGSRYANVIANMPDENGDGKYYGWMSVVGSSLQMPINAFGIISFADYITDIPISTVDPTTVDPTTLHAVQSIPVQWPRTGDGTILETSFDITVTGGD